MTESQIAMRHAHQSGIAFMVIGTMIAPGMDAIAKHLSDALSPLLITWGRFTFQVLIMSSVLFLTGGLRSFKTHRTLIHWVRGALLATATLFFFWALQYLPLTETIAIFFVQPILVTLLSAFFLGETIGWHRRLAVAAGFIGALIIIRPGTASFSIYYFLPLGAALFYAIYLAVTRAYATVDTPAVQQMASGVGGALFLSVLLGIAELASFEWGWTSPSLIQWGWLFAIGLIASIAHTFVVMGMSRAPASVLAPFGYSEIIAATILGWWIFGDWPDALSWLGILVIVSAGIYVAWRETHHSST